MRRTPFVHIFILIAFLLNTVVVSARAEELNLPSPAINFHLNSVSMPIVLKGMKFYPDNPGRLDFILDTPSKNVKGGLKEEANRLIKYFLTALTIPEDDIWVNLSPYEHDRMIPEEFGITEMGKDFLSEDYILKQLTASLIYPEKELGKKFWQKFYQKAYQLYGTTNIPINSFNKVWIVPDKAVVYVHGQSIFVVSSHLKVMSDKDYVAEEKYLYGHSDERINTLSSDIVKELLVPEIEREVNEGPDFLKLRQVYQAMILAVWYKNNLHKNILSRAYINQKKIEGIGVEDKNIKEEIYQQYLKAFKKGAFNYIKEDYDVQTKQTIPRKYFSGGLVGIRKEQIEEKRELTDLNNEERQGLPSDHAMIVDTNLMGVPQPAAVNPYGQDPRENVCRGCSIELDPAYGILNLLKERSQKPQKLLLIGVGRGVSAMELALLYPNLQIWAVNKEKDLWDDSINKEEMMLRGYNESDIQAARQRINVIELNILDVQARKRLLGDQKFDMVFFEPRVQIYFEEKVSPIEDMFNDYVKEGGEYGFVANGIFTSGRAFQESDFGSPIYERNPDAKAVALINGAFQNQADLKDVRRLGGNLYLRFHRISPGNIHIPLKKVRNEEFTTPKGLALKWSIYDLEGTESGSSKPIDFAMFGVPKFMDGTASLLDFLLFSSSSARNPILLLGGDPGAGKSTLAEEYRDSLLSRGYDAVVVNTDLLFKTKDLLFKQVFLRNLLKLPYVSQSVKLAHLNELLVDSERVNSFITQYQALAALPNQEGEIRVPGLPVIHIRPETVVIIEGSLADFMFGKGLPISKKVYLSIESRLQQERIIQRGIKKKGQSPDQAKLTAELLSSDSFANVFQLGLEEYDAIIHTDNKGRVKVKLKNPFKAEDFQNGLIKTKKVIRRALNIDKYGIGDISDQNFEYAAFILMAATMYAMEDHYFRKPGYPRVIVGFGKGVKSKERALQLARILAGSMIPVTLAEESIDPFVLAESTRVGLPVLQKYDLAFHVDESSIRTFEDGITTNFGFTGKIDTAYFSFLQINNVSYYEFDQVSSIPQSLFKTTTVLPAAQNRLKVFDIGSLKKGIPDFLKAMRKRGITNITSSSIEKTLDSLGMNQDDIGSLDFNINKEGAVKDIRDLDGHTYIQHTDLALIFLHYLNSIGEKGRLVTTFTVTSDLQRIAEALNIKHESVDPGVKELIQRPEALVAVNSTGHIHFNYKGQLFTSSPAAERLLLLEILIHKKMTLNEYLMSIYAEIDKSHTLEESIEAKGSFEGLREKMNKKGALNLAYDVASELGWRRGKDVEVVLDYKKGDSFKVSFLLGYEESVYVTFRFSTSAADTLRIYIETPSHIRPQLIENAIQKVLLRLTGEGRADPAMLITVKDNKPLDSYGGISFKSRLFNIRELGEPSNFQSTVNPPRIPLNNIAGIVPVIISIKEYVPEN